MQRLDLQFYSFSVVVLCGTILGLLFDLLRFTMRQWRPGRLVTAVADLLFWGVATAALSGALFYGNWGEIRLYVLIGLLLGILAYSWLASPVVLRLLELLFSVLLWVADLLLTLWLRLIWHPLLAVVGLVVAAGRLVIRGVVLLSRGIGSALIWMLTPVARRVRGSYRWIKLQYLLALRRRRRRRRR